MKDSPLLFLMLITCVLITQSMSESEVISSLCPPAEEGRETSIAFSFHQKNLKVTVERFNYTIARCNVSWNCEDFRPKYYRTTLEINQRNSEATIIVSVFNTTRTTAGYWSLVHTKVLSKCNLLVFSRARQFSCKYDVSAEGLHIFCGSSEIYPEAKCRISKTVPNGGNHIPGTLMICKNQKLQKLPGNHTYYRTHCSLVILVDEILPGKYNMELTMYPNVTDSDTDVQFGTDYLMDINLEHPRLVTDCKYVIEEDTEVTCVCKRSDSSPIHASVGWIDGTNNPMSVTNVLTFNANRKRHNKGFYCVAQNTLGLKIAKRFYSPIIISKSHILTCTKAEKDGTFTVTCTADGIIPFGLCEVNFNDRWQVVLNVSKADNGKENQDDDTLHWSSCEFNITRRDIRQGQNEILISMYSNVTGYDSDKQFGANQSIFINIDHAIKGMDELRDLSFNFLAFVYVVMGNVLIFVMFLGIWWCKQIENKRPDNDYDEINHEVTEAELADYQRCNGYRTVGEKSQDDITEIELHAEYPKYETIAQWVTQT